MNKMLKLNVEVQYYLVTYKLTDYKEKELFNYLSLNLNGALLLNSISKRL